MRHYCEKLNRGVSKPGCFPLFSGKVQIVSRTLSGLFLVGALNRPRKRKRTNRENPRTIPAQIGKIPEKSGKSEKGQKRTKKEGQVQIGKPPCLAALDTIASCRKDPVACRVTGANYQDSPTPHNDFFCLQKARFHPNPAPGTEPCKWQVRPSVCMVQTPYFVGYQPVLWGFGASFCEMGDLAIKAPVLHKPLGVKSLCLSCETKTSDFSRF